MSSKNQAALKAIAEITHLLPQLDNALFGESAPAGSNEFLLAISEQFKILAKETLETDELLKNKIIGLRAQMDVILQKAESMSGQRKTDMHNLIQRTKAQNSYGK
jgi:hypothetical protein